MEAIAIKTMNRSISHASALRLQHTIKCPGCRRKLCDVALGASARPVAEIRDNALHVEYDLELRCASCKAYVGVRFG